MTSIVDEWVPSPGIVDGEALDLGAEWVGRARLAQDRAAEVSRSVRLERAIDVIYRPETERQSHYFRARLSDQFDAIIHIDNTQAVEPLEMTPHWEAGEVPETIRSPCNRGE